MSQPSDTVTLLWPTNTSPAVINGKFSRLESGEIRAEYTRYELALAMACMGRLDMAAQELARMDVILGWKGDDQF